MATARRTRRRAPGATYARGGGRKLASGHGSSRFVGRILTRIKARNITARCFGAKHNHTEAFAAIARQVRVVARRLGIRSHAGGFGRPQARDGRGLGQASNKRSNRVKTSDDSTGSLNNCCIFYTKLSRPAARASPLASTTRTSRPPRPSPTD